MRLESRHRQTLTALSSPALPPLPSHYLPLSWEPRGWKVEQLYSRRVLAAFLGSGGGEGEEEGGKEAGEEEGRGGRRRLPVSSVLP